MKKYLLAVAFSLIFISGIYLTFFEQTKTVNIVIDEKPTDFAEKGTLVVNIPSVDQSDLPRLVYEKPGQPALTKKLIFDDLSICGSLPCMAMSATLDVAFGGMRTGVEGIIYGEDSVIVRKLTRFSGGEIEYNLQPGSIFISWVKASELIRQCSVDILMQAHSQDVYLTLKDGRNLRTVEPQIDEVFSVYNAAKDKCGDIVIGTE